MWRLINHEHMYQLQEHGTHIKAQETKSLNKQKTFQRTMPDSHPDSVKPCQNCHGNITNNFVFFLKHVSVVIPRIRCPHCSHFRSAAPIQHQHQLPESEHDVNSRLTRNKNPQSVTRTIIEHMPYSLHILIIFQAEQVHRPIWTIIGTMIGISCKVYVTFHAISSLQDMYGGHPSWVFYFLSWRPCIQDNWLWQSFTSVGTSEAWPPFLYLSYLCALRIINIIHHPWHNIFQIIIDFCVNEIKCKFEIQTIPGSLFPFPKLPCSNTQCSQNVPIPW